jgi:hypothetical protein
VWARSGCRGWYLDDGGRPSLMWPRTMRGFRRILRRFDAQHCPLRPAAAAAAYHRASSIAYASPQSIPSTTRKLCSGSGGTLDLLGWERVAWKGAVGQGPSTRSDYGSVAAGLLVGAGCGTALALALDNIVFGICVGIVSGVSCGNAFKELRKFADDALDREQD